MPYATTDIWTAIERSYVQLESHYTVMANWRHGIFNYRQVECCSAVFSLTTKKSVKLHIVGSFWEESDILPISCIALDWNGDLVQVPVYTE